jgi:transcriptional regulator with XRE-family HTH domain
MTAASKLRQDAMAKTTTPGNKTPGSKTLGKKASAPKTYGRTFFRQWRKYRDLTLEELAARMSMTPSHLSMLERGQRGYTQATLETLAAALRVDKGILLMVNPDHDAGIWPIWHRATASQKARIEEAARNILKKG